MAAEPVNKAALSLVTAMARFPAKAAKMTLFEVVAAIIFCALVGPYSSQAWIATGEGPYFQRHGVDERAMLHHSALRLNEVFLSPRVISPRTR